MNRTADAIMVGVETRTEFGKNACRRLRARGLVPATLYGLKRDAFALTVDPRRVEEILGRSTGRNTIFTLSLGGASDKTRAVMLRELQRDPLTERLVHVDFIRVDPTKRIHVRVPVRLLGIPEGVKNEGGLLEHVHREVEVACLPTAIPEHLDLDVSHLHNNQHVAVKDLAQLEDIEIIDDPEMILAVVAAPRLDIPEAAPAAEGAEPALVEGEAAKSAEEGAKGKGESAE